MVNRLLNDKRELTRFQILVQIAEKQPAVSQTEIAESIGVTPQAISEHMRRLIDEGLVENQARGRYNITKEGVDLIMSHAEDLQSYLEHVTGDIIGDVFVEAAVADTDVNEGERVSVFMRDGRLHVDSLKEGSPTAVTTMAAEEGEDVGITDFSGIIDMELGSVDVIKIPSVERGGSREVDIEAVRNYVGSTAPVFASGVEAEVTLGKAGIENFISHGTTEGIVEACRSGISPVVLVVEGRIGGLTDRLEAEGLEYEVRSVEKT
ncbi:MAG: winged helix-turn-helix transcriptional regulator [Halobacteria archaeon]|nr:winged helix-turn-helix transcriptional regulator [Halobacteria archaeon]